MLLPLPIARISTQIDDIVKTWRLSQRSTSWSTSARKAYLVRQSSLAPFLSRSQPTSSSTSQEALSLDELLNLKRETCADELVISNVVSAAAIAFNPTFWK